MRNSGWGADEILAQQSEQFVAFEIGSAMDAIAGGGGDVARGIDNGRIAVDDDGKESGRRILEERYNLEDALVVATFLNSFLNHSHIVKIANMAQLVNVIAPFRQR